MADFNDVVKQLQANNEAEKSRDSNLNRNIASLRDSNKEAFGNFITSQQKNTKSVDELVDSETTNKAAEIETGKDANFKDEKQLTLLEKLSEGISGIAKSMKDSFTKFTGGSGGFGKFVRGTLFAGLLIAIATFLQSDMFKDAVDVLTNTIMPALENFFEKSLKPFGRAVAALVKGDFAGAFTEIMKVENPLGLAAGFIGLATLLAPGKMFKVLKGGIKLFGKALNLVGIKMPGFAPKLPKGGIPGTPKGGIPGVPTKAKGIVSTAGNFAKKGVSAGKGIGGFIGGILKGIASGLAAIANPATLVGLAAVVLAINGIALAIRIMSPAFEPIGKMMDSFGASVNKVFKGIGSFVESTGKSIRSVIEGIGTAIGDVVEKLSKMSTAGTEATTKQIKELSKIPSDKLLAAAKGIDAMKAALDGFGGGTFSKIAGKLFGGGGPIDKLLDLTKEVPKLMKAAEAISVISAAGGDFAMAQAELKRREKVAELEKDIAGGTGVLTSDKNIAEKQAELGVLKKQKMELVTSGNKSNGMILLNKKGLELFTPSQPGFIEFSQKTAQMLQSGSMNNKGGGAITTVAPTIQTNNNQSNASISTSSSAGNQDQTIAFATGQGQF